MAELVETRSALAAVDPRGLDYDAWLRIVFAAKAAGLGLGDVLAWSSSRGNPKHEDRETERTWGYARADGGVTERTLFQAARQAGWKPDQAGSYTLRTARREPAKPPAERLHALPGPDTLTLNDLLGSNRFFPVAAGNPPKPYGQQGRDGQYRCWKQSLPREEGGAALARDGGLLERSGRDPQLIMAWSDYPSVAAFCAVRTNRELLPALGFCGDADRPAENNLGVLDFDYKPGVDPAGEGLAWRDAALRVCQELGLPCFRSRSGNGFHALFRLDPADLKRGLAGKRVRQQVGVFSKQRLPELDGQFKHGAAVDCFFPSAGNLVVVRFNHPAWELEWTTPIPALTLRGLNRVIWPERTESSADPAALLQKGTMPDINIVPQARTESGSEYAIADRNSAYSAAGLIDPALRVTPPAAYPIITCCAVGRTLTNPAAEIHIRQCAEHRKRLGAAVGSAR